MNNKQRERIAKLSESAPISQLFVACIWWNLIRKKKFKKLINNLEQGYDWDFSYRNTKK